MILMKGYHLFGGPIDMKGLHTSGVTVGRMKDQPFLPMLSWLFGQLAGVLQDQRGLKIEML